MSEIVLIKISGQDQPGITATLMSILAEHDVRLLDIGQTTIQGTFTLAMTVKIPSAVSTSPALDDLRHRARQLDLTIRFDPVDLDHYEPLAESVERSRYIVTVLGRRITARQIARIAAVITAQGLNIEAVVRLSERQALHDDDAGNRACIELAVAGQPRDPDIMRTEFFELSEALAVDISFQEDNSYRRNRRLVVFDMDSTLIRQEAIDELAREAGVGDEVARVTAAAMAGELDFKQSLARRVALLEGLEQSALERVAQRLTLTEGAERLLKTLRALGFRTAVISGGFTYFGRFLQQRLPLDYLYANELEIRDGRLTGRVVGEIVDAERKASRLREIAAQEGIELAQVVAVGDGANDLPMLRLAGLGIAFHAKPVVHKNAAQAISTIGLDAMLYLMGMKDSEIPH